MATFAPPTKTTSEDINVVVGFLKSQIGWTSVEALRKRLPSKHTGARKIDAMRYLGLIERDGDNVKLTGDGRSYADADPAGQATAMADRIREIPLYHATVEWLHYTHKKDVATKTDVANHWHDSLSEESAGVTGDSLGDASVFFLRVADLAGLGKFTAAGIGRETHLEIDRENLAAFVAAESPPKKVE